MPNEPHDAEQSILKPKPIIEDLGKPLASARQQVTLPSTDIVAMLRPDDTGKGNETLPCEPNGPGCVWSKRLQRWIRVRELIPHEWRKTGVVLRQGEPHVFEILDETKLIELEARYDTAVPPELSEIERLNKEIAFFEQEQMTVQLIYALKQLEAKVRAQIEATLVQI